MSDLRPFEPPSSESTGRTAGPPRRRPGLGAARADLRARPGQHFLGRSEFLALLVSRRDLARLTESAALLHGLFDRVTEETFWIEAERLATAPAH